VTLLPRMMDSPSTGSADLIQSAQAVTEQPDMLAMHPGAVRRPALVHVPCPVHRRGPSLHPPARQVCAQASRKKSKRTGGPGATVKVEEPSAAPASAPPSAPRRAFGCDRGTHPCDTKSGTHAAPSQCCVPEHSGHQLIAGCDECIASWHLGTPFTAFMLWVRSSPLLDL